MAEAVWVGFLRLSLIYCPVRLAPTPGAIIGGGAVLPSGEAPGSANGSAVPVAAMSNIIAVEHFSPRGQIERARLDPGFFLYTEVPEAADTLEALRLAMLRSERDGIGYLRSGDRERMVLIQSSGGGLMLSTLRPPRRGDRAISGERPEREIAADLVEIAEAMIGRRLLSVDVNALHNGYEARQRSLAAQAAEASPPQRREAAVGHSPASASPLRHPRRHHVSLAASEGRSESAAADAAEAVPPPEPAAARLADPDPDAVNVAAAERAAAPAAAAAAPAALPPEAEETVIAAAGQEPLHLPARAAARAAAERNLLEEQPSGAAPQAQGRDLGAEVLLHIMGLGDRRFAAPGWAGHPGSRRQVEAMSIRPREGVEPSAIEFRVFAQEGRATSWVSNGNYAGTRGRHLPLTGFAVRAAPELRDRFDIVYEGCFFDGGVIGPKRNGEICTSPVANDPLEAVRVSIYDRSEGPAR